MHRVACAALFVTSLAGCGGGGSGGGSGGSGDALFAGPLMYVGMQMRIYGSTNLQLADFNDDGFPELLYDEFDDVERTIFTP